MVRVTRPADVTRASARSDRHRHEADPLLLRLDVAIWGNGADKGEADTGLPRV